MASDPQQWEYCFFSKQTEAYLMGALAEAGRAGWEMVSVGYNKDLKGIWNWTAFLKRPLAPGAAPVPPAAATAAVPSPASSEAAAEPQGPLQGFDLSDGDFNFKEE